MIVVPPFAHELLRLMAADPRCSTYSLRQHFLKPHHKGRGRAAYNRPIRVAMGTLYDLRFAAEHRGCCMILPNGRAWLKDNP